MMRRLFAWLFARSPHIIDQPGKLIGRGTYTSASFELRAGLYRIDYQFDSHTRVALLDSVSEETLFIKSGEGEALFEVVQADRYRLRVKPSEENVAWRLAYRPVSANPQPAQRESVTPKD